MKLRNFRNGKLYKMLRVGLACVLVLQAVVISAPVAYSASHADLETIELEETSEILVDEIEGVYESIETDGEPAQDETDALEDNAFDEALAEEVDEGIEGEESAIEETSDEVEISPMDAVVVQDFADFQSAIAAPDTTAIEIESDIDFTSAITIPVGRTIELVTSSDVTLTTQGNFRHFIVEGELTLTDGITLTNHDPMALGGGVNVVGTAATFTMEGGIIEHNTSSNQGGGVFVSAEGSFNMFGNALIYGNFAYNNGGGVYVDGATFTMNSGTIDANEAVNLGGGVYLADGSLSVRSVFNMHDGIISRNVAQAGAAVSVDGRGSIDDTSTPIFTMYDGQIRGNASNRPDFNRSSVFLRSGATFNMYNGLITGVLADGTVIRGIRSIYATSESTVNLNGGLIERNYGYGGTIRIFQDSNLNIFEGMIIRNNVIAQSRPDLAGAGGAINLQQGSIVHMYGGHIYGNEALSGGAVVVWTGSQFHFHDGVIGVDEDGRGTPNRAHVNGGSFLVAVYRSADGADPSILTINNGRIAENISSNATGTGGNGGGITTETGGITTLYSASIIDNTAGGNGGGIHLIGGTLNLRGAYPITIQNNTATNGGGINWTDGTINTAANEGSVNVTDNNAGTNGGGIRMVTGTLTITDDWTISGNTALNGGGLLVGGNNTYLYMIGGIIGGATPDEGNKAGNHGGGVFVGASATMTATGGTITNNHAALDGGGIFTTAYQYARILTDPLAYSNISIAEDVVFSGNTAGNGSFTPPTNWDITDIRGNSTSPAIPAHQVHQLNNYDVNFRYLGFTKEAPDREEVFAGEEIEYVITVSNPSQGALIEDFVVVDEIDTDLVEFLLDTLVVTRAGTALVAGTDYSVDWNDDTGVLEVTLHGLPANSRTLITFSVEVLEDATSSTVRNRATLRDSEGREITTPPVDIPVVPRPTLPPPVDVCPPILVNVDEDGNVVVISPPGIDYEVSTDREGNIVVHFPSIPDECEIRVTLPGDDWAYNTREGEDGSTIIVIVPPKEDCRLVPDPEDEKSNQNAPTNRPGTGNDVGQLPQTGSGAKNIALIGIFLTGLGAITTALKKARIRKDNV